MLVSGQESDKQSDSRKRSSQTLINYNNATFQQKPRLALMCPLGHNWTTIYYFNINLNLILLQSSKTICTKNKNKFISKND